MTERQAIAYANPCYRAHDTMNPAFSKFEAIGGKWVSSLLSLNK